MASRTRSTAAACCSSDPRRRPAVHHHRPGRSGAGAAGPQGDGDEVRAPPDRRGRPVGQAGQPGAAVAPRAARPQCCRTAGAPVPPARARRGTPPGPPRVAAAAPLPALELRQGPRQGGGTPGSARAPSPLLRLLSTSAPSRRSGLAGRGRDYGSDTPRPIHRPPEGLLLDPRPCSRTTPDLEHDDVPDELLALPRLSRCRLARTTTPRASSRATPSRAGACSATAWWSSRTPAPCCRRAHHRAAPPAGADPRAARRLTPVLALVRLW
jgi:hypothetical protein